MGGRPVEGKGGPSRLGEDEASGLDGGLHGIAPVFVGQGPGELLGQRGGISKAGVGDPGG